MSIALTPPVRPAAFAAPQADDNDAADILSGGQPNVGLFSWTSNDLTGIKDIITYVKAALEAANRAEAAADQANITKDHVDEVANRYEAIVQRIDVQYAEIVKLAETINVDVNQISEYVNQAKDIQVAVQQQYEQIDTWRGEIMKYTMLAVYKYYEDDTTDSTHLIDITDATVQKLTISASNTTITLRSPAGETDKCRQLTLMIQQGTGSNKVTWPSTVKWNNGRTPVLSYDRGKVDVITLLTKDSGASWYGFYNGGWFDA